MGKKLGMNAAREKDTMGRWALVTIFLASAIAIGLILGAINMGEAPTEAVVEEEVVVEEESYDYDISCQANTILAGALSSCFNHERCNLSNSEMTMLYIAAKSAVIDCKKAQLIEMFQKVNEQRRNMEEPVGELDVEERADTDFLFVDPDEQPEIMGNQKRST